MPDELSYLYEKFHTAVRAMASSASPIQKRLWLAHTSICKLRPEDFEDPQMRAAFEEISTALVPVTLAEMTDGEAERIADLIVDLFLDIAQSRVAQ
jgi:hypothetical protein